MLSDPFVVVVWEFRVRSGSEERFEQDYGCHGPWARLFETSPHFIRTDLQRDLSDPSRYWTLDVWTSESDYNEFRAAHAAEYQQIDAQCEQLTRTERQLGRFRLISTGEPHRA